MRFIYPILRILVLLGLAGMLVVSTVRPMAAMEPTSEEAVKAAILFNFIRFVSWPESGATEPEAPRVVGFIGRGPVQEKAIALVASASLDSMVSVLQFDDLEHLAANLERIQVLYIARSARKKHLPRILGILEGRPILTVSDDEEFVRQGGMMNFVREKGRIRFDINLDAAEKSRLKMSAKLFGLARRIVKTTGTRQ